MKIGIFGAGATGGFLGARLARSGADVLLIARGPHLAAMRERGLRVREAGEEYQVAVTATDDLAALRDRDAVFLTVKTHGLPPVAPQLAAAIGPETALVTAQNGIPWWYFQGTGGPLEGTRLRSVDPEGTLSEYLEPRRVIGCVVWPATHLPEPGVVEHVEGTRFTLGEPSGEKSERCRALAEALTGAGLKAPVSREIRSDIWLKLLGNVAFNPMSVLTRATLVRIASDPETRAVAHAVMEEAGAVARALGVELKLSVDQRLAGAEKVGEHRTSMLQDLEAGRPLELEAMAGAVVEIAELLGLPHPHLRTVYACARLLSARLDCPLTAR